MVNASDLSGLGANILRPTGWAMSHLALVPTFAAVFSFDKVSGSRYAPPLYPPVACRFRADRPPRPGKALKFGKIAKHEKSVTFDIIAGT